MKTFSVHNIALLAIVLFSGCTNEEEFEPLFNGHDLTGWVNVNGASHTWRVEEGVIICSGIPTGVLRTIRHYENFILELEWKHTYKDGNAGLFVHSDPIPVRGKPFTRAIEGQIMDGNHGDVFAIQGATMEPDHPHPEGWMRSLPSEARANPYGEWNHYRVESRDGNIMLAVNGKMVSGGSKTIPRKGYICLESEGSEVQFRNIRIRELPSSNPPPSEIADLDEGFVSLYTGVDLAGWHGAEGIEKYWQPRDWMLAYLGRHETDDMSLLSERNYENFELIVDWQFTEEQDAEAQGGIIIRGYREAPLQFTMSADMSAGKLPFILAGSLPDTWYRTRVLVKDNTLTVFLNERVIIDQVLVSALPAKGYIGLLGGNASIQFANLYIKEL